MEISPNTKTQIESYVKNIALSVFSIDEAKIKFIAHDAVEQSDKVSCGIFALKNLEIIQEQLSHENPQDFLENFNSFSGFCKQDDIVTLYKKYANNYLDYQLLQVMNNIDASSTLEQFIDNLLDDLNVANNSALEIQIKDHLISYFGAPSSLQHPQTDLILSASSNSQQHHDLTEQPQDFTTNSENWCSSFINNITSFFNILFPIDDSYNDHIDNIY